MNTTEARKCKRCGYAWVSRTATPRECPQCKSRLWNKARVLRVPVTIAP
jgi:predicted Zn-ribbon and HTH transcriptional regulator